VILAIAIFVAMSTGTVVAVVSGFNLNRTGAEKTIATQFTAEGMEAVRSIKNRAFSNLSSLAAAYCTTGAGVQISGGVWTFKASGTTDTLLHNAGDNYIRTITVCPTQRNIAGSTGDIVASGGVIDSNTMKVTVTTTWYFTSTRQESVSLTSYFTNYKDKKGGMLVYGNGGTTTDAIQYKVYSADTDTWSAAASTADIDSGTTNRALRAVRLYASSSRDEKIAISRHYNGTTQYIYASVFNGTSWLTPTLLTSWNAATFLDVRNFDGAYLSNGYFLVVYSDNSNIPKFRAWNGTAWSAQTSTQNIGGVPNYITTRVRPGTNEVMAVFFDQSNDTNSQYFNGASCMSSCTYTGSNWILHTEHAQNAPLNTKELIDFNWNPNSPTLGGLNYVTATNDRRMNLKVFTADGSGGGSWSGTANTPNQGTVGAINIDGRYGANEFLSCDKDASSDITCFRGNTTPVWATPTNNVMTTNTEPGIERSFDVVYESVSGATAVIVYSDNTATPKLRKYNAATNAFDASATNVTALSATLFGVRMVPQPSGDDIMMLMFDGNRRLYTQVWDGTNALLYSSGGRGFTTHGINGSLNNEFWGNFIWDRF